MTSERVARAVRLRLAAELAGERASLRRLAASITDLMAPPTQATALMRTLALAFQVEVEGLRPAVLPEEAMSPLRELLGFRHYARHGRRSNQQSHGRGGCPDPGAGSHSGPHDQ